MTEELDPKIIAQKLAAVLAEHWPDEMPERLGITFGYAMRHVIAEKGLTNEVYRDSVHALLTEYADFMIRGTGDIVGTAMELGELAETALSKAGEMRVLRLSRGQRK